MGAQSKKLKHSVGNGTDKLQISRSDSGHLTRYTTCRRSRGSIAGNRTIRLRRQIERAFQLAQSGNYRTIEEIKKRLAAEGYWGRHITGRVLLRQLRERLELSAPRREENPQRDGSQKTDGAAGAT